MLTALKFPSWVRVGGHTYRVVRDYQFEDGDLYGQTDHSGLEIHICGGVEPSIEEVTFFHELIHAVAWVYGVKLGEKATDRLANGLYQALNESGLLK